MILANLETMEYGVTSDTFDLSKRTENIPVKIIHSEAGMIAAASGPPFVMRSASWNPEVLAPTSGENLWISVQYLCQTIYHSRQRTGKKIIIVQLHDGEYKLMNMSSIKTEYKNIHAFRFLNFNPHIPSLLAACSSCEYHSENSHGRACFKHMKFLPVPHYVGEMPCHRSK